ncbi:kinase-like domain-containing protein [Mycena amicta]|nr:kinase-like domain-containing protein [Mycena amicta]
MPASDALPDFAGRLVDDGRIQLLNRLGSGAYGIVYRGYDTNSPPGCPRYYAVKCMGRPSGYTDREISLHGLCSTHPSVITLHRQFYVDGLLCIVLDIAACDLWTLIDEGVFLHNSSAIKKGFLQVVDAVQACHDKGIFHCDLKPGNILCSHHDEALLICDFGMATQETACSHAAGTTIYMPPEALTLGHQTQSYAPADSDVWACAVILLNMMTASFPWRKATSADASWAAFILEHRRHTYLRQKFPISAGLNDLLVRCFDPSPESRPSLAELRTGIANMPSLFRDPSEATLPITLASSAPTTPGASFHFEISDASSASSVPTSDGDASLLRQLAIESECPKPLATGVSDNHDKLSLQPRPAPAHSCIPAADDPAVLALAPEAQAILARLRARPAPRPQLYRWIDPGRLPASEDVEQQNLPKTKSRNPLKRVCHWIRQRRAGRNVKILNIFRT